MMHSKLSLGEENAIGIIDIAVLNSNVVELALLVGGVVGVSIVVIISL